MGEYSVETKNRFQAILDDDDADLLDYLSREESKAEEKKKNAEHNKNIKNVKNTNNKKGTTKIDLPTKKTSVPKSQSTINSPALAPAVNNTSTKESRKENGKTNNTI